MLLRQLMLQRLMLQLQHPVRQHPHQPPQDVQRRRFAAPHLGGFEQQSGRVMGRLDRIGVDNPQSNSDRGMRRQHDVPLQGYVEPV